MRRATFAVRLPSEPGQRLPVDRPAASGTLSAMAQAGKFLALCGAVLVLVGLLLWFGPKIPWLGRLPGDVVIEKENFRFYFPITTCLLISVLLTLIAWFVRKG